jgi:hypothetical protein
LRWTDPVSGERRSQELDTVDDALDYQAYLRLARRRGALDELSRGRAALTEFVEDDWWPNHAGRRLSRHALTAYSQLWNRNLLSRVGHVLTTPTVQMLREALEPDGVGPSTVRKSLAVLHSICAHAVGAHYLRAIIGDLPPSGPRRQSRSLHAATVECDGADARVRGSVCVARSSRHGRREHRPRTTSEDHRWLWPGSTPLANEELTGACC